MRDRGGESIPKAELSVYDAGTLTRENLFLDSAMTLPAPNPFIADLEGRVDFYLLAGTYDLVGRRHGFEEFRFLNVDITDFASAPSTLLAGDVTGAANANTVVKIRGRTVETTAPANNEVLTWKSGTNQVEWELPPAAGDPNIIFLPGNIFQIGEDDAAATGYTEAVRWDGVGGASGNYSFTSTGLFLNDLGVLIMAGSQFYLPSSWFGGTMDIDVWATSTDFFGVQARVRLEIGNLAIESTQTWLPEDGGGSVAEVASAVTIDNGVAETGTIQGRNTQGVKCGLNANHVDTQGSIVLLGVIFRKQ